MKKTLNWGTLGCSNIADMAVIPAIAAASNARLYAIAEEYAVEKLRGFKQRHNPEKTYESFDMLLNDPDVDVVHIPQPNSFHYKWVFKAAQKKKHILCEKPLGCTAQQAKEMFEAALDNGVMLMEAFAYRHSPVIKKAKELVDNGVIGKIKMIESYFDYDMHDLNNVRLIKDIGGGVTYDVGSYNYNFIRYIAGREPVSCYAVGEIGTTSGVDENVLTVMEFEGGLMGISHAAFNCGFRNEYRIMGDEGIIEALDGFNAKGSLKITVKKGDDFFIRGVDYTDIIVDCSDNYMLEIEQFGRCILEGEAPLITQKDTYNNALLVDRVLMQVMKKEL